MSWRRVLLLSLGFVVALGCVTWFVLHSSDAATTIVRRKLTEAVAAPTAIRATELDLANGRLTVRGLAIDDPARPGTALLAAERIDIDLDADPFGELVALQKVAIKGLVVDLGSRLPTIGQLLRAGDHGASHFRAPAVEILDSTLRVDLGAGRRPLQIAAIELRALPTTAQAGKLTLAGGGRIDGLQTRVDLSGTIDTEDGGVSLVATIGSRAIDAELMRWLEQRLGFACPDLEVGGSLRDLALTFTNNAGAMHLEARGTLAHVLVSAPFLPRGVRDAEVAFVATNDRDGDLVVHLEQSTEKGRLDATAEITRLLGSPSYSVRAAGEDIVVDDDALDALRMIPIGARIVDALRPTAGLAKVD
ncbi:MAG: hypothetical protein KDC98_25135, partial [Planctomycetes bacterium]|nr:hypothetical protein [Planctomycetota bacterium]